MILTPFFEEITMAEDYENIPEFDYEVLEEEKANPDQNKRLAKNLTLII